MRRGHSGIGGWRSEYPRFRPRNVGHPQHRESKPFEGARFPPTGSRPYKPAQSFFPYQGHNANQVSERRERKQFRPENRTYTSNRYQERGASSSHRPSYSAPQHRHDIRNKSPYKERHYNDQGEYASKRDIDYRQVYQASHTPNPCNRPQPWAVDERRPSYDDISPQKTHKQDIGDSNMSSFQSAHRPPSSDHYSANFVPLAEHSSSFKHSFDDTVNIVRNRILNRFEGQPPMMEPQLNQINNVNDQNIIPVTTMQQTETPAKRKLQRRGPNMNTNNNCNQMKNNIFQQLFKMDKNNIHKLIDNPSSSSKFEYALNSLVEESQNSLNRLQRSIAEKSLCLSSTQFINSDNNTIYEDTFMKQMQGCLDPQDTVFLEDIKPIVMAELTKILQLDENFSDGSSTNHSQTNYFQDNEIYVNEDLNKEATYSNDDYSKYDVRSIEDVVESFDYNGTQDYEESKPIFERRPLKRTCDYSEKKRLSSESRRQSSMSETQSNEPVFESSNVPPYFTVEINSDEDETFAELDKQYHVPVDHNFIKFDDPTELEIISVSSSKSPSAKTPTMNQNDDVFVNEINNENINSNTNLPASSDITITEALLQDLEDSVGFSPEKPINNNDYKDVLIQNSVKVDINSDCKINESEKSDKSKSNKSVVPSNARKRSTDERSSHRKEKRRKSDTSPSHLKEKCIKEKNRDDTTVQSSEQCKTPLSNHTKNISDKEHSSHSHVKNNAKEYSDKYVKRKETSHETKDKHLKSRRVSESNASNHSIVSPKSVRNANSHSCSNNKADIKNKLKTIDMFIEKPRKATVHQALRNTASTPKDGSTNSEIKLPKLLLTLKKDKVSQEYNAISEVTKATKESQTDLSKISTSRFCQTDVKKVFEIAVQTDPVCIEKTVSKTKDALERMKEIDMEIQVLLQEKFKLYTSSVSTISSLSNMPSLGMTVFNVAPMNETKETDSSETTSLLEANFTEMPFEEVGDIAFDVIQQSSPSLEAKRNRRQTKKKQSHSPSTTSKRSVKKAKTPNISLIEQIISDDKPIEDIISLDELERSPIKTRNKTKTGVKKMTIKKTKRNIHNKKNTQATAKEAKLSMACKMRECSVVLERIDLDTFSKHEITHPVVPMDSTVFLEQTERESQNAKVEIGDTKEDLNETSFTSGMQIDMLDVSEDIIIGESCEVKMIEEKDSDCQDLTASSDEIILDNSHSEDVVSMIDGPSKECKTYDYLLDEGLKRDSVTVLANGDSVLAIEFLEDGFLAACLDGNVYYFNSKGQLLSTLRASNFAVTCLNIAKDKYGTTVYTGSLDSRVRYYDLENGLQKGPESNVLHSVQAMDRAWDTLFVGTRKGYVFTFECKNNQVIPVTSLRFSENSILAIRALKEGPRKVLLVAARTDNVTVKDAQTGLLLRTLEGPKMTVYSLLYEDGKVFCGTSGHQIQIFDYSSGAHVSSHEGGKGVVCLRSLGGLLFAGCYDGCVYVYSQGERTPIAQLRGPNNMLLSLAVKGDKIIVGYQNKGFYIWKIPLIVLQEMVL